MRFTDKKSGRPMSDRRCPDCDVQMEQTSVTAEGVGDLYVETERDGGVLDHLGVGYQTPLHAFLCPECGATQLYADLSE
jgi:rubredoxin